MPIFIYTARMRTGEKVEGTLEASDRRAALLHIERLGQMPVKVEEKLAELPRSKGTGWRALFARRSQRPRMGARDLLNFTSELSDLLASGMKLGNALNTLSHRRTSTVSDLIVRALRDEIIRGTSLSDAMAQFKETFPTLYVSLIRAGEASGNVSEVMARIIKHYERIQEVKEKVLMALVYPCIVMVVGIGTLIFAMTFVIPRFTLIFKDMGSTLPVPTRILIGISTVMIHYGWLIAIVLVGGVVMFRRYLRTEIGRTWWHGLQLRIPLIRDIITSSAFSQFARTLGMLIANGVPVLDALAIGERTVQNSVLAAEIRKARDRVTDGTTISGPLAAGKVFPPMLTDMLAIGEETGDMSGALAHIARRYEANLDRSVKIFTTVLEPIMIVLIAIMVGFVAISILLAVFDLTSGLRA
ncbi:MAG: type II secretion system F family protein [Verrucomicrobia bacterium]|nr:type II secretion system F family protein [Verrucomicrobiota bacterium]MBU1734666.1 type II secretion system F family protein [Verrucomicrobiota bacterium]MBU1856132.1 type II secretion system F family protein [Verrucomicrobiota bacterium]